MAAQTKQSKKYENNPFFIATNGITLLFDLARGVAILFVIISVLSLFRNGWSDDTGTNEHAARDFWNMISGWSPSEWAVAVAGTIIVTLAIMLIVSLFGGVSAYTSAQLAKGKKVGFSEAFRVAFNHLWSFLWLQVVIFVKLLLWTLLFIIPGIIMAVRYSLASTAFYDDKKNLRGNAAIKESIRLTHGAWITTFAGNALLSYLTFGVISWIVTTGANAVLYRQLDPLADKEKPAAHWLSWLTLILPFALIALLVVFAAFIAIVVGFSGQATY